MENYSYEEAIAELEKLLRFDFVETWNLLTFEACRDRIDYMMKCHFHTVIRENHHLWQQQK